MTIPISCSCGARFNAPPHLAGKRVKCPTCSAILDIPTESTAPPSTQPAKAPAPKVQPSAPTAKVATKAPTQPVRYLHPGAAQGSQANSASATTATNWERVNLGLKIMAVGIGLSLATIVLGWVPCIGTLLVIPVSLGATVAKLAAIVFCLAMPTERMCRGLAIASLATAGVSLIATPIDLYLLVALTFDIPLWLAAISTITSEITSTATMVLFYMAIRQASLTTRQSEATKSATMLAAGHGTLGVVQMFLSLASVLMVASLFSSMQTEIPVPQPSEYNQEVSPQDWAEQQMAQSTKATEDSMSNFAAVGALSMIIGLGILLAHVTLSIFSITFLYNHEFENAAIRRKPSSTWT